MNEIGLESPTGQTAMAISAIATAFVRVLQEVAPESEPAGLLQRKVMVEMTRLRSSPGAEVAAAIVGYVRNEIKDLADKEDAAA